MFSTVGFAADQIEQWHLDAIAGATRKPYWLDTGDAPEANQPLTESETCDLCIVGGGFTGLWSAIVAKERDSSRDVVLIEADRVGWAASGRNGGFVDASLTHGLANGLDRWPDEIELLDRVGMENLDRIERAVERYGIDCGFERTGNIEVVTNRHPASYLDELRHDHELFLAQGYDAEWLDRDEVQRRVASPIYQAGIGIAGRVALVDPARLAWGLKTTAERLGVRIYEGSPATGLGRHRSGVTVELAGGSVSAARVALATNAYRPLVRRAGHYVAPVYDYCLVTEPLSPERRASIGWDGRQGVADAGNQFHYYRLTDDNRILWGGYDAIYHWGGRVSPRYEHRPESWARLAANFFTTFPQLEGVRFTNAWGGAIDTTSRFAVFWGTAMDGRVGYALGYTGLGVGASRIGASVMLDLLDGRRSALTDTRFVTGRPVPFPPEPLRFLGIQATRWSMAREDSTGRRNLWLRGLDRLGMGFDS
jgi:glycine/D-amino acid oxidase-like deaminating enzyme